MSGELWSMAATGLLTSAVAPLLVIALRDRAGLGVLDHRAVIALPLFVLLHAFLVLAVEDVMLPIEIQLIGAVALLVAAMVFWSPVLGRAYRLADDAASVYLFLALPALDLPAVIVIARGSATGGLAMIVAMMPIGIVAVVRTWRWIAAEERAACAAVRPEQVLAGHRLPR